MTVWMLLGRPVDAGSTASAVVSRAASLLIHRFRVCVCVCVCVCNLHGGMTVHDLHAHQRCHVARGPFATFYSSMFALRNLLTVASSLLPTQAC